MKKIRVCGGNNEGRRVSEESNLPGPRLDVHKYNQAVILNPIVKTLTTEIKKITEGGGVVIATR